MANVLQIGEPSTYMWIRPDLSQDVKTELKRPLPLF